MGTGRGRRRALRIRHAPSSIRGLQGGKAKQDFLEDVEKRRAERDKSPLDDAKPKTLTVQVDGQGLPRDGGIR